MLLPEQFVSGMQLFDNKLSPAIAEARSLHPDKGGFFAACHKEKSGKFNQKLYPVSQLDDISRGMIGMEDSYISQATFKTGKNRSQSNAQSLRCVFVDLDVYSKHGGGRKVTQELIGDVEQRARDLNIPAPSYIANSGRGLYAKWVFESSVGDTLLPHWKILQRKLVGSFLEFGSDSSVTDTSRILRLLQTVNSKSGESVFIERQGETHSFTDLYRSLSDVPQFKRTKSQEIIESGHGEAMRSGIKLKARDLTGDKSLTNLDALNQYSEARQPILMCDLTDDGKTIITSKFSIETLNWARFLDLRDLVIARGGIDEGSRDVTLFWMITFLAHAKVINPANFWEEVGALLSGFPVSHSFRPTQDGSLGTIFKKICAQSNGEKIKMGSREYDPIYTSSNNNLISIFQISPDEERSMRTIISECERIRRSDAKVPGRSESRQSRCDLQLVAVAMKEQGLSSTKIAQELGKNRSTIHRWLTPIKDVGAQYIETRGRKKSSEKMRSRKSVLRGGIAIYIDDGTIVPKRKETETKELHGTRSFTDAEVKRRTHTRVQKTHLCKDKSISNKKMSEWMESARSRQEAEKQIIEQTELLLKKEKSVQNAIALSFNETIRTLKRVMAQSRVENRTISLLEDPSVSSDQYTGPPRDRA